MSRNFALLVSAFLFAVLLLPQAAALAGEASVARGGRLYDNWFREMRVPAPSQAHPAHAAAEAAITAAETWRCNNCHGWDYRGAKGMPGIGGRGGTDPAAIVGLLKDKTHGYGEHMRDSDLLDLANFVARGQIDTAALVTRAKAQTQQDVDPHEDYYGTICAGCHGRDGKAVRDVPPLGDVARKSPNEALHMIMNGHPGGNMPPLRVLGPAVASDMLAFLLTLPTLNLPSSIVRGGRLYDAWYVEIKALPPSVPHPAYPPGAGAANDSPRTWRCKECHGWDYMGAQGSYASGSRYTGIKGIRALAGADSERIVAILRDPTHRFGAVLKRRDLQDLANFVAHGQVDMDAVIDRASRRAKGDAANATDYYETICANCHGSDGRRISTAVPLGRVANESPWESLHKIMNGHPSEAMPALRVLDKRMVADILAYLQKLPEDR